MQRRRGRNAAFTFSLLAMLAGFHAACGGAAQSDLFTGSGGVGGGSDSAAGDARLDGPRQDSGIVNAQPDASLPDAPSTVPDATIDAAPDSSPPPPPPVIGCGSISCVAGTQTCCAEYTFGSLKSDCRDIGKCTGAGRFPISCDGDDDCQVIKKDTVCCVTFNQGTGLSSGASCYQAKDCVTSQGRIRTCDPNSKTNVCESGDVCRVSTHTLPGYFLCLPPL